MLGVEVSFFISVHRRNNDLPSLQHLNPLRRVQFGLGAVLPHSNTPSLRVAGFEDEDEYEAPTLTSPLPSDRPDLDTSCAVLRQRWRSFRVRPAGELALRA